MNRLKLLIAALGLALGTAANADTILVFGQNGTAQTIFDNVVTTDCSVTIGSTCFTEIEGVNVPITITAIAAATPTPITAFLNLDVTATSGVVPVGANGLSQNYAGSFHITSGLNGTGTNYLSANFIDLVAGINAGTSLTLAASNPDPVSFTSDVITTLSMPRGISFGFTNVTPAVSECGTTIKTICNFTSNVSGNMSAFAAVPEPGTLALLGLGIVGMALRRKA